jgi:large subunit ribosomal protein L1
MSGKKYLAAKKLIDRTRAYGLEEGMTLLLKTATAKFDESCETAIRLGVDPRRSDQIVRGVVVLPHGVGKTIRVLVFARGEKEKEALEAGASWVGVEEFVEKIQKGWLEFERVVATPDTMRDISKLGRILGPRGLMPSPKSGTVTFELKQTINELKKGRIEYRVDKGGVVHSSIGRVSFGVEKLCENFLALFDSVLKNKPSAAKGQYIQSVFISTTHGPSVKLNTAELLRKV